LHGQKGGPADSKALRVLKEDNDGLQREVQRKDKTLESCWFMFHRI